MFNRANFLLGSFILMLLIIGANIFYLGESWRCSLVNKQILDDNEDYVSKINNLDNTENYQNSDLFKDKQIKNRNYRQKGEIVIDTSILEPVGVNSEINYIQIDPIEKKSNLVYWVDLLLDNQDANSTQLEIENSSCSL